MKLIYIDTTRNKPVIALNNKGDISFKDYEDSQKHSDGLLLTIESLLNDNNMHVSNLDGFACVVGPGSFTGIRVGMATIKAFNKVLNKKIYSANIFEIVAKSIFNGVMLLNCTYNSLYYGIIKDGRVTDVNVIDNSDLHKIINQSDKVYGLADEHKRIVETYNTIETINNYQELLILYFNEMHDNQSFVAPEKFEPFYVQISQAERDLLKKQGKDYVAN